MKGNPNIQNLTLRLSHALSRENQHEDSVRETYNAARIHIEQEEWDKATLRRMAVPHTVFPEGMVLPNLQEGLKTAPKKYFLLRGKKGNSIVWDTYYITQGLERMRHVPKYQQEYSTYVEEWSTADMMDWYVRHNIFSPFTAEELNDPKHPIVHAASRVSGNGWDKPVIMFHIPPSFLRDNFPEYLEEYDQLPGIVVDGHEMILAAHNAGREKVKYIFVPYYLTQAMIINPASSIYEQIMFLH